VENVKEKASVVENQSNEQDYVIEVFKEILINQKIFIDQNKTGNESKNKL
jgi:hypothetical protein